MFGLGTLARVAKEVHRDVRAVRDRDPAARGATSFEILGLWPASTRC
jgi:serine O-acetyltransferase